jgi:CRP-like cAMP-binding protein
MSQVLLDHIRRFTTVTDEEYATILGYFNVRTIRKKENLLKEGQICRKSYFVTKGILRKFFISQKGIEQTTEFAIESWWMTDNFSFLNESKSEFYIQAVERTELLELSREHHDRLLQQHPLMEKYFRCVYQKAYAASQMRIKYMHDFSREALYHHFSRLQPEFLQRVPQYLVASYLGFTPEYLSEIRRKSVS